MIGVPSIGGNSANNTTSVSRTHGVSVSVGDLVVIQAAKFSASADPFVLADCSQSGGTATLGTIALDVESALDTGGGGVHGSVATWSAIVTGAGTLTMSVGGAPAGSYLLIGVSSISGSWDASRLENSDIGGTITNNQTSETSAAMTNAGAAIAFGSVQINTDGATTITPAAGWTTVYENEAGTDDNGSFIYQTFASAGTITPSWTSSGATNDGYASCGVVYKEAAGGGGRIMSPRDRIGSGGMSSMTGGMSG